MFDGISTGAAACVLAARTMSAERGAAAPLTLSVETPRIRRDSANDMAMSGTNSGSLLLDDDDDDGVRARRPDRFACFESFVASVNVSG